jgi:hypothetical protein
MQVVKACPCRMMEDSGYGVPVRGELREEVVHMPVHHDNYCWRGANCPRPPEEVRVLAWKGSWWASLAADLAAPHDRVGGRQSMQCGGKPRSARPFHDSL